MNYETKFIKAKDIRGYTMVWLSETCQCFDYKHRTPKVCPFVSLPKNIIIMLAKVDFDGKEHIAIVLNSRMGLSWVLELRKNLVSFMETAFCSNGAMLDSNELYNVTSLLNEMEFTEDQSVKMIDAYFGKGTKKAANTKTCEISF